MLEYKLDIKYEDVYSVNGFNMVLVVWTLLMVALHYAKKLLNKLCTSKE